ncbi:NAD(P)-dependent oxidoreductase [Streptomyces uncialis]|uniref:NAD(P)-dependent oxidoreductase n=1 Tax=Streptomyces uncialis TaxID=1048205 RepID=UPI00382C8FF9
MSSHAPTAAVPTALTAATTAAPTAARTPVTVLGLGAMGRALAAAFLRAGHPTTVWNRSPGRADELVAQGATEAATAAEAVRASPLVVLIVLDHKAVTEVTAAIADELPGRTLVNLTADTPDRARETAVWAADRGIDYLDGSVMVPVQVIGTPHALLFHAGPRELFDRYADTLGALGGRIEYVGAEYGLAAAYDLALLDYFYASMSGLVHAFALAEAEGADPTAIAPFFDTISGIMPSIAAEMGSEVASGDYPGGGANLGMMAATVEHLVEVSEHRRLDTGVLYAIKSVADRALAAGRAKEGWTATVDVVRPADRS